MVSPLVALMAFALSVCLTWLLLQYALRRGVIDVPNDRSSHRIPTPRGGGLAIAVAFLFGVAVMSKLGSLPATMSLALFAAGLVAAAVGFWDDHVPLPALLRLALHFLAAVAALFLLGGMPAIPLLGVAALSGWPAQLFGALLIVWLLNLYNFMDGIDGIAATEAVTVCAGGAAASHALGYPPGAIACLLLAAASAGFLLWNLPPAKIFMGDVGSGFLGVVLGVIAVDAARRAPELLWCWLILLGVFIVDATLTLMRRALRGERVHLAHSSHAYQHAARALRAHGPVTLAVAAINLFWLVPIALLVAHGQMRGELAVAVAYVPLVLVALHWHAGQPLSQKS